MQKKQQLGEIIRFGIVGVLAVAIHYAMYWLREQTSARNGAGFAGAHIFNYFLQLGLFNFFLWVGLHRLVAPFAVLLIAVPTNFIIVRFVFKHFSSHHE